ncbi:MAG: Phosphoesterase, putative (modular protein) [Nitrospira sp.]|jgi:putative phosphoesterase|nr:Phosphoesterase, putative (modular protein) [Nitrospira sp.]
MEHRSGRAQAGCSQGLKRQTCRLGVIADTHGLYDPAVEPHFAAVSEILHAGDVGGKDVIQCLQRLAPVTAVSGNVDGYERSGWARRVVLQRGGITIVLCHVLYENGRMNSEAQAWLDLEQPDVCIFGHSHRPTIDRRGRTILFNPGSAGPKRFSLPRGVGILTISRGQAVPSLIQLGDRAWKRSAAG